MPPLVKQPININFAQGLNTKTDPYQVPIGQFLRLQNSVFTKGSRLTKRNGYGALPSLPDDSYNFTTTFNGNLTATGTQLAALADGSMSWVVKGDLQPVSLNTLPLIRSGTNQSQCDSVISSNGFICTVYTDNIPVAGVNTLVYKYAIADSTTGQNIVQPTVIPSNGTVKFAPRVFYLGNYFIILFGSLVTATDHLQYIAINVQTPTVVTAVTDISTLLKPFSTLAFDGFVANNTLYIAYNATDVGGAIRVTSLSSVLTQGGTVVLSAHAANLISVTADESSGTPVIYVTFWDSVSNNGFTAAFNQILATILAPTQIITGQVITNLATIASSSVLTAYYERSNNYTYDSSIPTHYTSVVTCTQSGTVGTPSVLLRSVGIASKPFTINNEYYLLVTYSSAYQPTYFLINGSGKIISRFAYSNGGGYLTTGLPSVSVYGTQGSVAYLIKDLVTAVNKTQGVANSTGIYSQTGINLINFELGINQTVSAEIGQNLNLTGGFLWGYDGYSPVENNFFVWPDNVEGTGSSTGGAMLPQVYYYQWTYEWTDNQGNVQRSAPSIPTVVDLSSLTPTPITFTSVFSSGASTITVSSVTGLKVGQVITDTTTGGNIQAGTYITAINGLVLTLSLPTAGNSAAGPGGDTLQTIQTCSATINIPTLRLTYKTANPVRIVGYRWSTAQQNYYQTTSLFSPILNSTTTDSVSFVDTNADTSILGNSLIYTTGGVVENTAAPAFSVVTLFDSRLWGIDEEDPNLLWYSKQVIENTPVEMSDLFTVYIAPTISAQGSTGINHCLAPMDDKIIIFKENCMYFINGSGPDNTGANSQYSQPIFITSTVGCTNQNSIVFMQNGLMFQSDKGIWLLDRSLSASYIGAAVEDYTTGATVQSAVNVPGTTQVRFTLSSGITLMYDYFFNQWGTFVNVPAISSTLYQGLHTYINKFGQVYQEAPGTYLDGSSPVLQSFTTSWIAAAGLQGFQRAYFMYLLGTYFSPHKLNVQLAYDYNSSPVQAAQFTPDNFNQFYGVDSPYGGVSPYGGNSNAEKGRIFFEKQKCESIQIIIDEIYDASLGQAAGQGLTLSGLNVVIGVKKGYRTNPASQNFS